MLYSIDSVYLNLEKKKYSVKGFMCTRRMRVVNDTMFILNSEIRSRRKN